MGTAGFLVIHTLRTTRPNPHFSTRFSPIFPVKNPPKSFQQLSVKKFLSTPYVGLESPTLPT